MPVVVVSCVQWTLRSQGDTPMSDRFAESSPNTVSDIAELALYSTAVLFIVLLWVYVPA
jgi:hypothetical protein